MWLKGITTPEEYRRKPKGEWQPLSMAMLEVLQSNYAVEDEPLLEELYSGLSTQANVFKITRRNRFEKVNRKVSFEVKNRFPGLERFRIHDVGASSGITSLELFDELSHIRPVGVLASDFFDHLELVTPPDSGWTIVFDAEGRPVQAIGYGFALSLTAREARRYPVNRLLAGSVQRRIVPRSVALRAAGNAVRTVPLFHPLCLERAKNDSNFTLARHDVFAPMPGRFQMIRAMNFLNRCYFHEPALRKALQLCAEGLEPGGLLLIGRSVDEEDDRVTASLYEKIEDRLVWRWDENEGSELKPLLPAQLISA